MTLSTSNTQPGERWERSPSIATLNKHWILIEVDNSVPIMWLFPYVTHECSMIKCNISLS